MFYLHNMEVQSSEQVVPKTLLTLCKGYIEGDRSKWVQPGEPISTQHGHWSW